MHSNRRVGVNSRSDSYAGLLSCDLTPYIALRFQLVNRIKQVLTLNYEIEHMGHLAMTQKQTSPFHIKINK